jgi:hypothetical protein
MRYVQFNFEPNNVREFGAFLIPRGTNNSACLAHDACAKMQLLSRRN